MHVYLPHLAAACWCLATGTCSQPMRSLAHFIRLFATAGSFLFHKPFITIHQQGEMNARIPTCFCCSLLLPHPRHLLSDCEVPCAFWSGHPPLRPALSSINHTQLSINRRSWMHVYLFVLAAACWCSIQRACSESLSYFAHFYDIHSSCSQLSAPLTTHNCQSTGGHECTFTYLFLVQLAGAQF